ncbi:alanine racemase [Pseudonocardia asaccharolytica]|uniref:Diaminopimelate decarboxylase n=1 Tax=Pseudonocardia asaccharolytica DSM 44247 = NBRC 16224 TaxID=1123024 RepID=A0A511CY49_9PSEU|nr:alanine racemase [Pseudonocardia asaccharolytica]GEL17481.1 diaminopimelate decarboxylase [Pseudonocardia asaccharolytica DSM 44247 = NBRC 16224]
MSTLLTGAVAATAVDLAGRDALPAYVYDLDHLDAHTAALCADVRTAGAAAGLRLEVLHAVKANPDPGVLATAARHVDGLEVASGGELAHVRRHMPGVELAFGGPGKTDAELAAAVAARVARYHVESRTELRRLDAAARAAGAVVTVLLRVNIPGGPVQGAALTMGGTPSPFGMDPAEADACAAARAALPGVRIAGVHAHLASGLDPVGCAAQGAAVLGWALDFGRRHRMRLDEVNVGGGMAVDYHRPDRLFDWAEYGRLLAGHAAAHRDGGAEPVLRIEPGRAVSAYSGWYITRVLELKRSHGEWFAVCLGGTHHLRTPAAKGHDQPLVVLATDGWDRPWARPDTGAEAAVTFVGQLCTPKDVLARRVRAGRVRAGDVVVFALAGAYAYNISHRDFLLHPGPHVVHLGTAG